MSRWAYFSKRPEAREHLFESAPWYALTAKTKCGLTAYTMHLRPDVFDPDADRKPSCRHCLAIITNEETRKCRT